MSKENTPKETNNSALRKTCVMWRCLDDFVMQNGDKETAFIKDKEYKQVGTFEGGIELINEQGYGHKIYGSCLKFFNAT